MPLSAVPGPEPEKTLGHSTASLGRTKLTFIYFSAPLLILAYNQGEAILPNWARNLSNLARSLDKASRISDSGHFPHRVPEVGVAQWSASGEKHLSDV